VNSLSKKPPGLLVLGHRGAILSDGPCQNSLRAFKEALDAADGIETDACADKDGEVFLIHEALYADPSKGVEYCMASYLNSQSARMLGARRLEELSTNDTRRLRLADGTPLPTLKEAVALFRGRPEQILDIELKAHGVVERVLPLLKTALREGALAASSVLLSSFDHPALLTVRAQAPELPVGAIFMANDMPSVPLFPWHPGSVGRYTPLTPEALALPLLKEIKPDYIIMPEYILTAETAALIAAAQPQAKLMAWVFMEKRALDLSALLARLKVLQSGGRVAGVMVDNPRQFVRALEEAGLRAPRS
jgi:glycerophosphoryl diester phosphodiesterase